MELGDRGVLLPGRWLWIRAIGWSLLSFAGAIFFFFATLMQFPWLHLPEQASLQIAVLGPSLAFGVYAFAVKAGERRWPREVIPPLSTVVDLLAGSLIGIAMLVSTLLLLWALGLYNVQTGDLRHWFSFLIFDSYVSGMLEELAFRGILLRLLARAFGPKWGLALSALAFGAAHLSHASWLAAAELSVNAGLTMGLLYVASGRLWMPIALHVAWDFTEGALLGVNNGNGLLHSTPVAGRSAFLTGGSFGPDGSLLAVLIGVVFIVGILYANSKRLFHYARRD